MDHQQRISAFLDYIRPQIGQEKHTGQWLKIDQERINRFAQVTGDLQWIHIDPQRAARESPYGTTIAHGYLTLSLRSYLIESHQPDFFQKNYPGMTYRINYGLNKVRFPAPVKVDSSIRARVKIQDVQEVENGVQICYLMTIDIQGNEKPACIAEFLVRLYP